VDKWLLSHGRNVAAKLEFIPVFGDPMATITIPDHTLARLQAAAAARHISVERFLDELVVNDPPEQSLAARITAANGIRALAKEITEKVSIDELISQKHAGHKY
jgi:hypothetical protein